MSSFANTCRRLAGRALFLASGLLFAGILLALLAGCSADGAASDGQADEPAASVEGFEHRSAEVNGVRLHYVIGGEDAPGEPVVLLHGFPETWYAWREVMPELSERHPVIAPDLRGAGESSLEESGYDKETMAEDVHALVRELGYKEVFVVGHDLGAMVAYAYAREHRREVIGLVFMDATLPGFGLEKLMDFSGPRGGLYHLVFFQQPEVPEALISGQERYYLTQFVAAGEHETGSVTKTDAMDEYVKAYSRPGRLEAGINQYRTLYEDAEANRRKALPRLKMPVLAVSGEFGTRGLPLESMEQVAENVEGFVVEDSGHYVQEEKPEILTEKLLTFFDR